MDKLTTQEQRRAIALTAAAQFGTGREDIGSLDVMEAAAQFERYLTTGSTRG